MCSPPSSARATPASSRPPTRNSSAFQQEYPFRAEYERGGREISIRIKPGKGQMLGHAVRLGRLPGALLGFARAE